MRTRRTALWRPPPVCIGAIPIVDDPVPSGTWSPGNCHNTPGNPPTQTVQGHIQIDIAALGPFDIVNLVTAPNVTLSLAQLPNHTGATITITIIGNDSQAWIQPQDQSGNAFPAMWVVA